MRACAHARRCQARSFRRASWRPAARLARPERRLSNGSRSEPRKRAGGARREPVEVRAVRDVQGGPRRTRTFSQRIKRATQQGQGGVTGENSSIGDEPSPPIETPGSASEGAGPVSAGEPDAVELALANALGEATRVGRWGVVAQLARELEVRRTARLGVVPIDRARRDRQGPDRP